MTDQFDFSKPWKLADLPLSLRNVMKYEGYEEGKTYVGEEAPQFDEVPVCPFCNAAVWKIDDLCKHIIFDFGGTNGGYLSIFKEFDSYFFSEWLTGKSDLEIERNLELQYAKAECLFPDAHVLSDLISDVQLYEICSIDGSMSRVWGFASPSLLESMRKFSEKPK